MKNNIEKRFWSKVRKTNTCWLWEATRSLTGYGSIRIEKTMIRAHRLSWELHNGKIPKGLFVLHKCDHPSCVNPKHLFLGSMKDNCVDRNNKNRQAKGENNGTTKLKEYQVLQIRQKYEPYKYTLAKLGKEYNVSDQTIHDIITRKQWKHL